MLKDLINLCESKGAQLIAVSKTKPISSIQAIYAQGQRHFGENRVQEMVEKEAALPKDIRWHLIGHLQKNKVKYIAPFVHLIHSVDSRELLSVINKEAAKNDRKISILLQLRIAQEDTKYGLEPNDAERLIEAIQNGDYPNINLQGLMGMASYTEDKIQIADEFQKVKNFKIAWEQKHQIAITEISMGMSGDYLIALNHGSTMIRVGSLIFGNR